MRCPKCGYISFDRQRSCGKCSNDLTAVAEQLKGTAGKATAPFFLGGVLGRKEISEAESGPALYEEEEALAMDELEAEAPQVEEELDFAGSPLDEADLEDQPLPSLGLGNIDFSDLVPPQEENQEPELPLEPELPSFEPDDTLNLAGQEKPLGGFEEEVAEPQANAEEDEAIIDLSSLMDFDETPAKPAAKEESEDIFELSLGDEPEELHLSLEGDNKASASADKPQKPASAAADIPDLGLTLEDDDK